MQLNSLVLHLSTFFFTNHYNNLSSKIETNLNSEYYNQWDFKKYIINRKKINYNNKKSLQFINMIINNQINNLPEITDISIDKTELPIKNKIPGVYYFQTTRCEFTSEQMFNNEYNLRTTISIPNIKVNNDYKLLEKTTFLKTMDLTPYIH